MANGLNRLWTGRRLGSVRLLVLREKRYGSAESDLLLVDGEQMEKGIYPHKRLASGEWFEIDPSDRSQRWLFARPDEALRYRLQIRHEGHTVWLRERVQDRDAVVIRFEAGRADPLDAPWRDARKTIRDVYGGRIEMLPPDLAIEVIEEVNHLLETDPYLVPDAQGAPGALLQLPDHIAPVLLGDLHGRPERTSSASKRHEGDARKVEFPA